MNRNFRSWIAIAGAMACAASAGATDIPRIGAIYYGKVLSAYGYPCAAADGVTVAAIKAGGGEAVHYDVGPLVGPGINYRLQVNVVAAGSGGDGTAVPEGGAIQIRATAGGQPTHQIGDTNVVVASGAVVRRDFILGADADGDGIPDEWEQFAIAAMSALGMAAGVTNIAQFNPNADYDGDGYDNRQEFTAGTLPFLGNDSLRIDQVGQGSNGTVRIRFLGNQGFSYQINASSNLVSGSWQVARFGTDTLSPSANSVVSGEGTMQTVYFPTNGFKQFLRLIVK